MKRLQAILLTICFLTCGYTFTGVTVTGTSGSTPESTTPKILPLGDSITAGQGETQLNYRVFLQDLLTIGTYNFVGSKGTVVAGSYDGEHSGVASDTTNQILSRLRTELSWEMRIIPDDSMVLIHAGTNGSQTQADIDNIETMIDLIYAHNTSVKIYVCLIIPRTTNNFAAFNTSLNAMLSGKQATVPTLNIVDMNSALTNDTFELCDGDYNNCLADGLHPNNAGYTTMAKQFDVCIGNPAGANCNGN